MFPDSLLPMFSVAHMILDSGLSSIQRPGSRNQDQILFASSLSAIGYWAGLSGLAL